MLDNDVIRFYRATGQYGFMSNLFKVSVEFEGRTFPTSEHAYQFGKFRNPDAAEWAMQAPKPHLLAIVAHGLFSFDISEGWNKGRVDRMKAVLIAKFSQNPELARKLVATGEATLVEDSKFDPFWGVGKKGTGKNMLGKLLMEVREHLKRVID